MGADDLVDALDTGQSLLYRIVSDRLEQALEWGASGVDEAAAVATHATAPLLNVPTDEWLPALDLISASTGLLLETVHELAVRSVRLLTS